MQHSSTYCLGYYFFHRYLVIIVKKKWYLSRFSPYYFSFRSFLTAIENGNNIKSLMETIKIY